MLEVTNIKVRYRNGALGVVDVSLSVAAGKIAVIFGPNGAGKTTTVRAVTGFLRAEGAKVISGHIQIAGRDTTNLEPHRLAELGVAFVPERKKVFANLSVAENLAALGTRPPRSRRRDVYARIYDLFPILADRSRELAGRLSGGQQQMLAIARGLIREPRLLVVDELTLGLHHSVHGALYEVVRSIADAGTAVIVVDESAGYALDVADYCYLLNSGTVQTSGPPDRFVGSELLAAGYLEG